MRIPGLSLKWLDGYSSSDLPRLPPSDSCPAVLPDRPPPPAPQPREVSWMSKAISTIVRPSAASRVASVRRAIADIEVELVGLEQQRAGALVEDDPAAAIQLAEKISAVHRRLDTETDRLKAFEAKAKLERIDRRQQDKESALAAFETDFADRRVAAASRVVQAARELSTALQDHASACRRPFAEWKHDLFPEIKTYQDAAYSYIAGNIASALRMNQGAAQHLLVDLPNRIADLPDRDARLCATLIEDIRNAPLPKQRNVDDEEIAA
jgi:hypothetical protein